MDDKKPPKRYKKTSFYICLGLAVLYLMMFAQAVSAINYDEHYNWPAYLLICIVFAIAAILLKRRNDRSEAAWAQIEFDRAEADRLLREQMLQDKQAREAKALADREAKAAQQAEWERTHGCLTTQIVGVTFDNEDGTSRQRLLKDAMANDCCGTLELEAYDYKGAQAVRVLYEGEQIGNVPKGRAEAVAAVIDRISAAYLNVERFVPEDDNENRGLGGYIYRADLTIVYTKDQDGDA